MRGFIALVRGVLDHPIVGARKPYSRHEAWIWLLSEAAWKPRTYVAGNTVVELMRGQLVHSTRYIAKAWGWPETNVRRFLKRLETGAGTGALISAQSGAGITIITICNYDRYQSSQNESGARVGALGGAANGAEAAQERRRKEQRNNVTKETDDEPPSKYAFESGVIRLNAKNLSAWQGAFTHLNLEAELISLAEWAAKQEPRWFQAVSAALAKRNREMGLRLAATKQNGTRATVLTPSGNPWPEGIT